MGPEGPQGPEGPGGPAGITVVSGAATVSAVEGSVPTRYDAAVTLPNVSLSGSVVNCWLQNPSNGVAWKVATDFYGTSIDACLASESGSDLLVSFGTRDSFWDGYLLIVTAAYSTP
jgi:hypothetical protein